MGKKDKKKQQFTANNKKMKDKPMAQGPSCQKESSRTLSHNPEFITLQADFFKVLADPVRLQIIELLTQGPLCVCEIEPFFEKSQAAVSKHLKALLNAGIITLTPEGTKNIYSLRIPKVLDVLHAGEAYLELNIRKQEDHIRRLKSPKSWIKALLWPVSLSFIDTMLR